MTEEKKKNDIVESLLSESDSSFMMRIVSACMSSGITPTPLTGSHLVLAGAVLLLDDLTREQFLELCERSWRISTAARELHAGKS